MEQIAITLSRRFLTFRVDAELYALRSEDVSEVIRVPALARVPQSPTALLGLANLRGSVLPVVGLRELLAKPAAINGSNARAIVLDRDARVALIVDAVVALETAEQIEEHKKEVSAEGSEKLLGAFAIGADKTVAKILDIDALLQSAFANRTRRNGVQRSHAATVVTARTDNVAKQTQMLVTFDVAGQEFALPLDVVQEVLPIPAAITAVARAEAVVHGVISVRSNLLPLLSLRSLLGLTARQGPVERDKVVVVKIADTQIGLIADHARSIVAADVDLVDPIPPVLAARTGGESRISSIYRGEAGRRLISILAPEQLFREDVMQRLAVGKASANSSALQTEVARGAELIFLVFRIGDDEFALPIDAVVEVANVPSQITRVPKAPKFLEGVINLRGDVLPVIDQRRRFDMPKLDATERRRLVVVKTERLRAGLIVDSISDVLRTDSDTIEPAPDLTDAITRLIHGVINLQKSNRMVLLLDPAELLTGAEQRLLDTFQARSNKAPV